MGSLTGYRARAAELRHLAEAAHGQTIRADLMYLAERFEKLAAASATEERGHEARMIAASKVPRLSRRQPSHIRGR